MNIKGRLKNYARDLFINGIASSVLIPKIVRFFMYKLYGMDLKTKNINARCFVGGNNISIGKNSFINYNCFFDNSGQIIIGNHCHVAMEVLFCSSTHEIGSREQRAGKGAGEPIIVEDGSWIGARATILPGVTIERGCVIAAGSVVTTDCKANGLYAGVPARRMKDLDK